MFHRKISVAALTVASLAGAIPATAATVTAAASVNVVKPVQLTKPMDLPKAKRITRREGDIACDEILFERLRELRKKLADARGVPAYIVFGDTTLRHLARNYPTRLSELEGITGVGEKKRAEFGEAFTAAIAAYLETNPRLSFD